MRRTNNRLFVSLAALGMAMPAFAQEAITPAEQSRDTAAGGRDVIIVTANKREETIQDTPVAITAFNSEMREQLGIISVTDLTNVTPGLSYTPGNERVTLRGIGRLSNSFGADPGVANYNDGFYTPFAVFAGKDPMMVDRVEVLRGPQGTLYGRNAIGGAINTVSKRPTNDFQAEMLLGIGNFDSRKAGVAVSGPITDTLRYRAVGFMESREGVSHNYGINEKEGWEINDRYLEGQLEGELGDRFSWWLKVADLNYDKAGPPGGRTASYSTAPYLNGLFNTGGLNPNNAFAYGNPNVLSYTQGGSRTDNPFATNREHAYNSNRETSTRLNAYDEAIFEAVYSLDNFDIKYTGGYSFYDYELYSDSDGTPIQSVTYLAGPTGAPSPTGVARTIYPGVTNLYAESRALFSNEINFISTHDGPLQWIVGLYQYQENSDQPGQVQSLDNEPRAAAYLDAQLGVVQNPDRLLQLFRNVSLFNAYGVYGQADYAFNDQWKLTAGLRWSKDLKESKEEAFLGCYIICGMDMFNYTRTAYAAIPGATFDSRGFAVRRLRDSWDSNTVRSTTPCSSPSTRAATRPAGSTTLALAQSPTPTRSSSTPTKAAGSRHGAIGA